MILLPYHVVLVAAGLGLVFARLADWSVAPTWPLWVLLPLLLLVPLERRLALVAERRLPHFLDQERSGPGRLVVRLVRLVTGALAYTAPLQVQALAIWQTGLVDWSGTHLLEVRSAWSDLAWLPLLAPLFAAHLLAVLDPGARRRFGLPARRGAGLRLRWQLFTWGVVLLYLGLSTIASRWDALRVWTEESSLASLGFTAALLLLMLLLVPRLLLALLDTAPPSPLHRRLAESPRFAGVSFRLLEWRTEDELANAMVLAMPFGPRPVLFTDAFLARLSLAEFEAVLAHELGHVERRHVGLMTSWVVGGALAFDLLATRYLTPAELDGNLGVGLAVLFLVGVLAAVGFLSRRLELEADLTALEATGDWRGLVGALERSGHGRRRRSGWRHFSIQRRVDFLRAAARDPGVGQRLVRSLRPARMLGPLLLVATLGATLFAYAERAHVEGLWIDLRRGEVERAAERFAGLGASERQELWLSSRTRVYGDLERALTAEERLAYLEDLLELGRSVSIDGRVDAAQLGELALGTEDAHVRRQLLDLALLSDGEAHPGLFWLALELSSPPPHGVQGVEPSWLPVPWDELALELRDVRARR
ncbi:MAG: M48 family metalloprotease [Planctomycetota bacterium]|nr:M48 family metalloprotease [Planctomycetota bacterium]